jgi:hypothetical protein
MTKIKYSTCVEHDSIKSMVHLRAPSFWDLIWQIFNRLKCTYFIEINTIKSKYSINIILCQLLIISILLILMNWSTINSKYIISINEK